MSCKHKDSQGYCELSNNISRECTPTIEEFCEDWEGGE